MDNGGRYGGPSLRLRLAAAAAISALFLSGCSGGGDTSQLSSTLMFSANRLDVPVVWGRQEQAYVAVVDVLAAGKRWNVSADAPWVSVPAGTQQGDATLPVTVYSSGLGLGAREARLTLVNADDPADTDSLIVTVLVQLPVIIAPSTLTLGGPDGLDTAPQNLAFSIDTGFNSYGWTLASVALVPNNVNWLELSKTSGTSSGSGGGSGDVIVVDANRVGLAPGIYDARLTLQFDVLGEIVTRNVFVTLNHEENRIYAVTNGVAFYEMPARSRLSADVEVRSSRNLSTIPWSAVSDQPWLTVTPSGLTGGTVTLQADTSALAPDTVHTATVTIGSADPEVQNQDAITVGLWTTGSNPGTLAISAPFDYSVVNPVFPYVHASRGGVLRTYNIYTGALVSTFALPYANTGGMAVSTDGRTVYVPDAGPGQDGVAGIDVFTGQVVGTTQRAFGARVGYLRVKGHPIVTPPRDNWLFGFGPDIAVPGGQDLFFVVDNSGPGHSYNSFSLDFSALYGGGRVTTQQLQASDGTDSGNVRAMAVVPDGTGYLAAVSGSDECRRYNAVTQQRLWAVTALGTPNNAVARGDGLLACGSRITSGAHDIQLLDLNGNSLGNLKSPTGDLLDGQVALSSDPFRLVTPTDNDAIGVFELP